jgi:hypothetical protein
MDTTAPQRVGLPLGPLVPRDLDLTRRPADAGRAVAWLLGRAAGAGDTVVRAPQLLRSLAGTLELAADDPAAIRVLEAAVGCGEVSVVPDSDGRADRCGLAAVVAAEEAVAEHIERLLVTAEQEHGALVVVPDLPGARVPVDLTDALHAAEAAADGIHVDATGGAVVTHAERLGLAAALELFARVPDGGRVVLHGDPRRLAAPGPGRVLADLLASRVAQVRAPDIAADGALDPFAAAVRSGTLAAPEAADRSVVVVPAPHDAAVVHRLGQLIADSIPRTFGINPAGILVLTPVHRGVAGARAVSEALAGLGLPARVATVADAAADHAAAVVLALPAEAAGVLDRALLLTAVTRARRHLSIVSAAGESARVAVARGGGRRPRTRLAELLILGD